MDSDWDRLNNQFRETEDERNERLRAKRREHSRPVYGSFLERTIASLPVGELKAPGIGRDAENDKSLIFYFSRRVSDEEMRFLHEVVQRACAMRKV